MVYIENFFDKNLFVFIFQINSAQSTDRSISMCFEFENIIGCMNVFKGTQKDIKNCRTLCVIEISIK